MSENLPPGGQPPEQGETLHGVGQLLSDTLQKMQFAPEDREEAILSALTEEGEAVRIQLSDYPGAEPELRVTILVNSAFSPDATVFIQTSYKIYQLEGGFGIHKLVTPKDVGELREGIESLSSEDEETWREEIKKIDEANEDNAETKEEEIDKGLDQPSQQEIDDLRYMIKIGQFI